MAAPQLKHRMSVEEFWELCRDGKPRELVRGEVQEKMPAGFRHGRIAMRIGRLIDAFAEQTGSGLTVAAETGFVIRLPEAPSVRAPDVAFIRRERLPQPLPETFAEIAPDLVVEVISPNDSYSALREKVDEWLFAGVKVIWVIDPQRRVVEVYQPDKPVMVLREDDTLSAESVLPGFALPVREIFAGVE